MAEIRRAIDLLLTPGQVCEMRVLNTPKGTVSGYFSDVDKLAQAATNWSGKAPGVYITLNPVDPELMARASNRVKEYARETTSDIQILARRWLPVDLDAARPAGISSTIAEHEMALERAREAREWLRSQGWPEPVFADSGNGAHLLYPIGLPNDQGATDLLGDCLQTLAFKFDDDAVKVDTGNFNAARIWKLYGTAVCKGDSTHDRPHRLARILEVPE